MFWLATTNRDESASTQPHSYVHNRNQDLATRVYNTQGLAGTNESIYANLMHTELRTADKKTSCAMWDLAASGTLTYAHITNAMRTRWGGIYTAKIAAEDEQTLYRVHTAQPLLDNSHYAKEHTLLNT
jgi:endonuclease/exonuclease/phosphatase (EEP) superfamily protein YafD